MDTFSDHGVETPQENDTQPGPLPSFIAAPSNKAPLREILEFLKRGSIWSARAKGTDAATDSSRHELENPFTD